MADLLLSDEEDDSYEPPSDSEPVNQSEVEEESEAVDSSEEPSLPVRGQRRGNAPENVPSRPRRSRRVIES